MTFPQTFAEKVLSQAVGRPVRAGEVVEVAPDWLYSHDNTAAIWRIFAEELGVETPCCPERLIVALDHASPPPTARHAQNQARVRAFVRQYGVRHFYEVGEGIGHQRIAEQVPVLPGQILLGADSHTTTHGWLGAFAAGVGRTEMAALWATGRLWLRVPESVQVELQGRLSPGVMAKDAALTLIGALGAAAANYAAVEFTGPGVATLGPAERMTLANMMAEMGAKAAYFPPDEVTQSYLAQRRPGAAYRPVFPDPGAAYRLRVRLHLDRVRPALAGPHRVDAARALDEAAGTPVDMAFIGTCAGGRYEDLAAAAQVLQGRRVHPRTRLVVVPASQEVYRRALESGVLATLLEAGAVIGPPGCGPCMGNHLGIPAPGEVVLSTSNRNFRGRMGEPEAEIYLAAAPLVAAAAVHGEIPGAGTSPRETGPALEILEQAPPGEERYPRLPPGPFPPQGRVWKYGDFIDTDRLFPGKYTYTLHTPEEIAAHALEDLDPTFARQVQPGDVVFAGEHFGQGSSREQAVTGLVYNGVAAVVAKSFARIFYRNALNRGLPVIVCPPAVEAAQTGQPVRVDWRAGVIDLPAGRFAFPPFPPAVQALLAAGGLIPALRQARTR